MKNATTGIDDKSYFSKMPRVRLLELQGLAASYLTDLAPKLFEEFTNIKGPLRVYNVAVHYANSNNKDHISMIGSLIILLNKVITRSEIVRNVLEELNAVEFFLYLSDISEDDQTRAHAIRSVSQLCSSTISQDQFRNKLGIQFLALTVKRYTEPKRPLVGLVTGLKIPDVCAVEDVSVLLFCYSVLCIKYCIMKY